MNRHPFRWESLAFGAFFLAIVGNWAVWKEEALTPRELSVTASVLLIAFGLLGVIATLRPRSNATRTTHADFSAPTEGNKHEETDPPS